MEESAAPKQRDLYLLQLKINEGGEPGADLTLFITKVANVLCGYANATKCLYKFKVTGEPRLIAVFEVTNVIGFERTVSAITRLGIYDITCTPLNSYEWFSKYLGVDENLTKPSMHNVTDAQALWVEFTIGYPGKAMEDLVGTWKREATVALGARCHQDLHIDLFKCVSQRKVHAFVATSPENWDELTFNLPLMKENGENVTIECHAVQNLDDYVARINSDTM